MTGVTPDNPLDAESSPPEAGADAPSPVDERPPDTRPPEPEEVDGDEPGEEAERVIGSTDHGRAASRFMVALNRAARSFLLYDPTNEAIRAFLQAVRDAGEHLFTTFGDLDLQVRPFELAVAGEVVYVETDRDRSLAFRLYRDGVRRVVLQADVTWQELIKLLEVVSVRYTGIRQTEDDMVVLLWKAGFQNIQVEAVEGVVEDDGNDVSAANQRSASHYASVPDDFDLPPPLLPRGTRVHLQTVSEDELELLRREDASTDLPALCVRLAQEMMGACSEARREIPFEEAVPLLRELRDFLLAESTLDPALALVRVLLATRLPDDRASRARDDLAATFLDVRGMLRLLRSTPRDLPTAPPEMLALLEELPGDHLDVLFQATASDRSDHVRRVARQLIEYYVPTRTDWMIAQLDRVDDYAASQLLHAISRVYPARAAELVEKLADRRDPDLHLESLTVLADVPIGPPLIRLLIRYTSNEHEPVRLRALALIARRAIRPCFNPLLERIRREPLRYSENEAGATGEALVRADTARAREVFAEWATPPKFFQFVPPGHRLHLHAAVRGLSLCLDEDAEKLIRQIERIAEGIGQDDVRRACVQAMVRRRRLQRAAEQR